MRRIISVIMAAALIILFSGCSNGTSAGGQSEESTIDRVLGRGTLVIGTSIGYLPFEMIDTNGNYVGYNIDTAEAMADSMGVKLEIKQYEFSQLISALQSGEIDIIISGMTIRGDRALGVSFSNPYFSIRQALMVPVSDTVTKSYEELDTAGKKIAVCQGSTGALLAKEIFENADIVDYDSGPSAALAVYQNLADALLYDDVGIEMFVLQQQDKVRGVYDERLSLENLGFAVRYRDSAAVDWLNSFLYGYKNSPAEMESYEKWFENIDWINTLDDEKNS